MKPGEVYQIYSTIAGKQKYHLCVALSGGFLFLNSPKPKSYEGDVTVSNAELPFLPPTPSGLSVVSCTTVVRIGDGELARKGRLLGVAPKSVLTAVFEAVEEADFLSEEEREFILSGLEDWL